MSTTIDERVVEMRFDNKQFESNARTSLGTIEKLKQSMNFTGASKGLDNIGAAIKKVDTSSLGNGVESVRAKFSALQVMGVTALANITNSAVNAGKRIASALTIDPIKMGLQEYETQIGAVQTILANTQSKGSTLDDVNKALDELNKYADQTIYNFTEMTRNIGTFTAAGVDLDKSVTSIKGIANLAAVSGSSSLQASTAMYQLSQALAAGRVSLMDWNSVVNAGMGGELFQNALKRTAENMGTNVDALIEKYGSFRESLTQGQWLTADVLTETLTQLSGAYTEADLIAQGYTKKQAQEIVELSKTAVGAATEVKTFSHLIDTTKEALQSGWTQSWEILIGDFEEAKELWTGVSEVLSGMINESAEARNEVLQGWSDLGGRTALIDAFKNTFEGLGSVIKPIKEAFREIFPPVTAKQLYNLTVGLKELTENFKISDKTAKNLKNTFKGIFSVIDIVIEAFKAVAGGAVDLIGSFTGIRGGFFAITGAIGKWISNLRDSITEANIFQKVVEGITSVLTNAIKKITEFGGGIVDAFSSLGSGMSNAFGNIDFSGGLSLLNSGLFGGILIAIRKFVNGLSDPFEGVSGLFGNVKGILDDVRDCFKAYQEQLKAGTLLKIATAIGILAAAILVISSIDSGSLAKALGGITVLFAELMGSLLVFTKISTNVTGVLKASTIMLTMSTAILILAGALKVMSSVDTADVAKGVVAIGAMMAELSIFLHTANFSSVTRTSIGLLALATSMVILASAVKSFGSMKLTDVGKGLLSMSGAMAAIGIALAAMPKGAFTFGVGLIAIGAALQILAGALSDFGTMSWEEIGRGLTVMGGALAELSIGLKLMTGTLSGSAALLIAAGALAIIAPTLKSLGSMSWEEIAKGLIALAGAFTVIGVAGALLSPLIPTILGLAGTFALFGVATLGIGAGLALIGVGLAAIATGFTTLAAAGTAGATAVVAALSIIISGLADLIPMLAEKFGEAIVAFATVIGECAPQIAESVLLLVTEVLNSLATYAPQIIDSLMTFLIGILDGIAARLPELIQAAAGVIGAFFQGVIEALGEINPTTLLQGVVAVGALAGMMAALSAITSLIPGAMVGVLGISAVVAEIGLILAAMGGLAQIPGLQWLIGEGGNFLQTIGNAIGKLIGGIAGGIAEGITGSLPQIGSDLSAFMQNLQPFIAGAQLINPAMAEGVKSLAQTILILTAADVLNGITSWVSGGDSLAGFAKQLVPFGQGLMAYANSVAGIDANVVMNSATAAKSLAELNNVLPNIGGLVSFFTGDNTLSNFGQQLVPFGQGLRAYASSVAGIDANAVKNSAVAAKALAQLNDILPNTGGIAGFFAGDQDVSGFGQQLVSLGRGIKAYSDSVAGISAEAINNSVSAIKNLVKTINSMSGLDSSGVSSFKTALSSLAKSGISSFVKAFSGSTSKLTSVGANMMNAVIKGVKSKQGALNSAVSTVVSSISKSLKGKTGSMSSAGADLMTQLAKGITSKKNAPLQAVQNVAKSAADGAKGSYSDFYSAGANLVRGFAAGISANAFMAAARARAMASAAARAAESELDEHSPSRVGYRIGDYFGVAFVNAIGDYEAKAYKAGSSMASSARMGLSQAISKVSDVINSDVETQPTIRPVLDLSNVQDGVGTINKMFGNSPSVGILANVGAISSTMDKRIQNDGMGDVVSAINKLRKDISTLEKPSYNINGLTYDDGSNVTSAVESLIRATKIERRV